MDKITRTKLAWIMKCLVFESQEDRSEMYRLTDTREINSLAKQLKFKSFAVDEKHVFPTQDDEITLTVDDKDVVVRISHFSVENDGIGHYEYCGAIGYDAGHTFAIVDEIEIVTINGSAPDYNDPAVKYLNWFLNIYCDFDVEALAEPEPYFDDSEPDDSYDLPEYYDGTGRF